MYLYEANLVYGIKLDNPTFCDKKVIFFIKLANFKKKAIKTNIENFQT
jgi:hypothetical protein